MILAIQFVTFGCVAVIAGAMVAEAIDTYRLTKGDK
jgi:hypothetical protein